MASENEKCETVEDIVAQMHKESKKEHTMTRPDGYGGYEEITLEGNPHLKNLADGIEAAWKRERERDERLLFRLLWFDIEDYQSDWACNAYRQTIKDCCARLGVQYHNSGKEIADEMDKLKLGVETAREVYDE